MRGQAGISAYMQSRDRVLDMQERLQEQAAVLGVESYFEEKNRPRHERHDLEGYHLSRSKDDRFACSCCGETKTADQFYRFGFEANGRGLPSVLYPQCNDCVKARRAEIDEQISEDAFVDLMAAHRRAEKDAANRSLEWLILPEDALQVYLRQDRKCSISGVALGVKMRGRAPTLLLINQRKGYRINNLTMVCAAVSRMKGDMTAAELIDWSKKIAQAC